MVLWLHDESVTWLRRQAGKQEDIDQLWIPVIITSEGRLVPDKDKSYALHI